MLWFALLLCTLPTSLSLVCQQCGGQVYSGGLRLSRDDCCHASPISCLPSQVCIRALVTSPNNTFFLSGCHLPEDGLVGCDTHSLPMNATVHRCICLDTQCQSYFPGQCNKPHPLSGSAPFMAKTPRHRRPPAKTTTPPTSTRAHIRRITVQHLRGKAPPTTMVDLEENTISRDRTSSSHHHHQHEDAVAASHHRKAHNLKGVSSLTTPTFSLIMITVATTFTVTLSCHF